MKLALATDAWHPQVNGVVRALSTTVEHLCGRGHEVGVIEPSGFRTMPCPTYKEIRLALMCGRKVRLTLDQLQPDAVHIATEGPIGWAARGWCLSRNRRFTTSFHTRFPDYISVRSGLPTSLGWGVMRRFHSPAARTFAVTQTLAHELEERGIRRTHLWPLGVDLEQFHPGVPRHEAMIDLPRPILLNVGRVAIEKNIEAFLDLAVPGSKVVVGGGPALDDFKSRYSHVLFLGPKHGPELASTYASSDVFVFPSRTDTFGLVNIEALACGLPIAAYPVPGPLDIVGLSGLGRHGGKLPIGALEDDLGLAVERALQADRNAAVREAEHYRWERCTEQFLHGLATSNSQSRSMVLAAA